VIFVTAVFLRAAYIGSVVTAERVMNRKPGKHGINERRKVDERRDVDRRHVDAGAPERRALERRVKELGPPERRKLIDRRDLEKGPPPGWKDRRREAERRIPEVGEAPYGEWARLRAEKCLTETVSLDHEALSRVVVRD